jgi:hypothetical protein
MTKRNESLLIGTSGYTAELCAFLTDMAGPSLDWSGVSGTSRLAPAPRRGLRLFLMASQGGICPECGKDETDAPLSDISHMVTRGPNVLTSDMGRGWVQGNLALQHNACNKAQAARGLIVNPADMARADLVQTSWPSRPILTDMGNGRA